MTRVYVALAKIVGQSQKQIEQAVAQTKFFLNYPQKIFIACVFFFIHTLGYLRLLAFVKCAEILIVLYMERN